MSVCSVCQSIDLFQILANYKFSISPAGRSSLPLTFPHHKTYTALRESAKNCRSCAIFYEASNADPKYPNKPGINENGPVTLHLNRDANYSSAIELIGALQLDLVVWDDQKGGGISYHKYVDVWADEETSPDLAALILNRKTGSVEISQLASKWLENCVLNHPDCRLKKRSLQDMLQGEAVALPTRVVDVGPSDGSKEPCILETNGSKGMYLTLSHCWGNGTVTKMVHGNLEERKKRISMNELSSNLRDAVIVTRQLEFQYLWIDSLCIIQDSRADWETEASRMAQVYNRSTLTLSAARIASPDHGFLQSKDGAKSDFVTIPDPKNRGNYYLSNKPSSSYLEDVERGPLNFRGWTLQERILSRRNLLFGRDQMHWECQTARYSQSTRLQPQEFSESTGGVSSFRSVLSLPAAPNGQKETLNLWYEVLGEFVKRNLTFGDDKLPALSGIVSTFNEALSTGPEASSYAAGIWKQDVARGLMWMIPMQEKSRVPSWSWSSVDTRVWLMRTMEEPISDISDIVFRINTVGNDRFGRVDQAVMEFACLIRTVPIIEKSGKNFQDWDEEKNWLYPNAILKDEFDQKIGTVYLDESWFDQVWVNLMEDGWVLYCIQVRHSGNMKYAERKAEALLACQVPHRKGVYRRVGLVEAELTAIDWTVHNAAGSFPSSLKDSYQRFLAGAKQERIKLV